MVEADLAIVSEIECRVHSHPWKPATFGTRLKGSDLCWVAEADGAVVGYSVLSYGGGDAELLNISVDVRMQNQGLGAGLLAHMIEQAGRFADMLFLEVRQSNHSAIALYSRFDFLEVGQRHGYYPTASGREDALIMARQL